MWAASDGEASATWRDGSPHGSVTVDEFDEARDVCCEDYVGGKGARGRGRDGGAGGAVGAGGGVGGGGRGGTAEKVEGCGTVIWGEREGCYVKHTVAR